MKECLNLKEIQDELLNILKVTINYLEKNNIDYSICAGTLLGAVRHQGFIPWDDDIDIAIDRKQYNRLLECLKRDSLVLSPNIEAIGFELKNANWPFIKIINKKILVDEKEKCDDYLWIDIFPYDGLLKKNIFHDIQMSFYKELFFIKRSDKIKLNDNIKRKPIRKIAHILKGLYKIVIKFFIKPIKFEKIIAKYIKVCSKYDIDKVDFFYNNVWGFQPKNRFPKSIYYKKKKYKFEDIEVNGIENYDLYLTKNYGDYMKLPPVESRKAHNIKAWRIK